MDLAAYRSYEDFEPTFEWQKGQETDTLVVSLPGFRKEQLGVQVTSARNLRVTGERQIGGNKWRRFRKEFSVASNCDTNDITAKFESGQLNVKLPKTITSAQQPQQKPQEDVPSKPSKEKDIKKTNEEANAAKDVSNKIQKNGKEPSDTKAKIRTEKADTNNAAKKSTNEKGKSDGLVEKGKATSSRADEKVESVGESVNKDKAKIDPKGKIGYDGSSGTLTPAQDYKQEVGGLSMELKKQRNVMVNLLLAVLLVLVFGWYVKNAIKSLGSEGQEL
ncbi:Inactive protein RESTRICTED TEV MOVEMENT 2 [Quillaja saponaria]|uniref:Inactive protein RESTRICTED TEV MOVEMENT 2 n=1 Tax=Quillaja saponaria TaxID=32244 RepID=A0AAD7LLJ9_QUISA|nr:Inactive protein RESTRICTED TEV MOVEMENT 2 [Quillaja saponaria]